MNRGQRKKAVVVAPCLYPCAVGGVEVFNESLIRSLSKDCEVSYITECTEIIDGADKRLLSKSRPIIQIFIIFLRLIFIGRGFTIVTSFMRTKWYYVIVYPLLNYFFRKRYIIIIHGGGMSKWIFKAPYKWYFKRASRIFGVSSRICKEYHERSGADIEYLPPMVPINVLSDCRTKLREFYQFDEKDVIFLWVGSLKELKNPMDVFHAMEHLGRQYLEARRVKMIFAGDGPLRAELGELVRESGLSDVIHLLGNVPRSDIPYLYRLSDNYIISSDYEGTPISMIEAMANGLIIIGSNVSGINTILGNDDVGLLFEKGNVSELANLIRTVAEAPPLYMKDRVKKLFANNFSYNNTLEKIKDSL